MNTKDVRILGIEPTLVGLGVEIAFSFQGTRFTYEIWTTDDAAGRDYHVFGEDGRELSGSRFHAAMWQGDELEQMDNFLDEVYNLWLENYEAIVKPAWEHAVQSTLIGVWDTIQMNDPGDPDAP